MSENIDFKSLRHYHASWLLTRNVHPKIVSERLGHESIKITLDILQEEVLNSLDTSSFLIQLDYQLSTMIFLYIYAQIMHKSRNFLLKNNSRIAMNILAIL